VEPHRVGAPDTPVRRALDHRVETARDLADRRHADRASHVSYHPDLIDLRPRAALVRQERMERLMERELLAAIVELEKTRQLVAAFTPVASSAS
jgi:hypothetical protein